MFVSIGKFFGKGKIRFGVGMRITKDNFWWMAIAALFYYMFLMMWYMIIFVFWLMYAMCYGMWWCIKKLFHLPSKSKSSISKSVVLKTGSVVADSGEREGYMPDTSPDSDYSKTIFLWAHQKAEKVKKRNEYASYLFYECGIQDGSRYHEKMIKEGLLVPASVKERVATLKVDELKKILSENGLSTTGKKDDLVERIVDNVSEDKLLKPGDEELYCISDVGRQFLENHDAYVKLHTHKTWGIKWQEYDAVAGRESKRNFYDTCWGIFNKRLADGFKNGDFGRNTYFNMFELVYEEGKYNIALEYLLMVLFIDLNGSNTQVVDMYRKGLFRKEDLKAHFRVDIMLAPGIVKQIGDLQEYYNLEMTARASEQTFPIQACDSMMFTQIVDSIMAGTLDEESTMKQLKKSYEKAIDSL